jgi:hypothetical protein
MEPEQRHAINVVHLKSFKREDITLRLPSLSGRDRFAKLSIRYSLYSLILEKNTLTNDIFVADGLLRLSTLKSHRLCENFRFPGGVTEYSDFDGLFSFRSKDWAQKSRTLLNFSPVDRRTAAKPVESA